MLSAMSLVDLTERAADADIRSVLSALAWTGEPDHIDRIVGTYATGPRLFGFEARGRIVGVIGIENVHKGDGVICHIAVEPAARRSGVGRAMVDEAMDRLALRSLTAETDADAIGFYRSCGFTIQSLGEKYPGVKRFLCERRRPDSTNR